MTAQIIKSMWWTLVGVGLLSVSLVSFDPVPQPQPTTVAVTAQTTQAAPYAHIKWVKLSELVPTKTNAPDVYVPLIAIDGEVFLAGVDGQ